jgi:hypothetical protein
MATLEKRLNDLEAQAVTADHCVKIFICNQGEDAAQARHKAGIPAIYPGKVMCVQFVESPNSVKEPHHGEA